MYKSHFSVAIKKSSNEHYRKRSQIKEKLGSFLRRNWRTFIDNLVHKSEWTSPMRIRMMGEQYWIIFREPLWKEICHSNCNINKRKKITEEAGPKGLKRLTDTWGFQTFYILILLWCILQGKTNIFWALWAISDEIFQIWLNFSG